jgi:hypothetical protein
LVAIALASFLDNLTAHSMIIRVSSDVERFTRGMDEAARDQVPFALARALTWTAQDAQRDVREELPKRFTIRRSYVSDSVRITPAKKKSPVAIVGVTDRAAFMERQETGFTGAKPTRRGHRAAVPVRKARDTAGFPNKAALVGRGQLPSRVRDKPRVFLVTTPFGAGILRREGKDRYPVTILYWLKRGVRIKPAFGFKGTTGDSVRRAFGKNFVASLEEAIAHAR